MKRVLPLLFIILMLAACGSKGIKDGEFTFDEDEFKEEYEDVSGELAPDSITLDDEYLNIDFVTEEEVTNFLEAAGNLIDDDKINKMANTIKDKGIDTFMKAESDNLFMTASGSGDSYMATIQIENN